MFKIFYGNTSPSTLIYQMLSWYKEEAILTNGITNVEYFFNSNDDIFCPDTINSLATDARKDGLVPDFIEGTKDDLRRLMYNQTMESYPKVFASVNGPFKLVQTLDREEPTIMVSFKLKKCIREKRGNKHE